MKFLSSKIFNNSERILSFEIFFIPSKFCFIASTVVSTPMIEKIAKLNNVEIMLSLTGFKWIGKMINDFPEKDFVAGGEESYGFLFGDFVRDKDAIASSLLICEILNEVKEKNIALITCLSKEQITFF